jgi:hypothetical protein
MAVCPKCRGEMGHTEAVCPHCGYDFPQLSRRRPVAAWVSLGLLAVWGLVVIFWGDSLVVRILGTVFLMLTLAAVWQFLREN